MSISFSQTQISCFLFDLDGTLVKTHIDFDKMRETVRELSAKAGVTLPTHANTTILESAKEAAASLGGEIGVKLLHDILTALEDVEMEGCANPELIPGTRELLEHLQQNGIKIGVVTRNCRRVSQVLLAQFELPHDVLLTRDDVAKTKPDPMHLHDALRILQCPVTETIMVGDHWLDIQAGKDAGCAMTVGVLGERDVSWFEKCRPDLLVKDLQALLGMLDNQG